MLLGKAEEERLKVNITVRAMLFKDKMVKRKHCVRFCGCDQKMILTQVPEACVHDFLEGERPVASVVVVIESMVSAIVSAYQIRIFEGNYSRAFWICSKLRLSTLHSRYNRCDQLLDVTYISHRKECQVSVIQPRSHGEPMATDSIP